MWRIPRFKRINIHIMNTLHTHLAALSLTSAFFASIAVAEETSPKLAPKPLPGQAETQARCLICHGDTQVGQARLAPPMVMVKRHYQSLSQAEFEKAVLAWVKKPDAKKSKMPGAIRRFNLMPTFVIPDAEIKLIAQYIHQTDFAFPSNCGSGKGAKGGQSAQGCDGENCGPDQGAGKGKGKGQGKNKAKGKGEIQEPCGNGEENC